MARRQPVFDSFLSQKGRHKNNEQNNEFGPDIEIIDSDNCSENGDVEFKNVNQGISIGLSSIDKEQNDEFESDADIEIIDYENYSAKGVVKNEISNAEQNDESDADVEIIDSEKYSAKVNDESKNFKVEISQGAKQKDESDADVEIIDSEIFSANEPKLSEISSSQDTKQDDVRFAAEVEIIDTEIINVLVIQSLTFVYMKETLLIKEFYDEHWEAFKQDLFKSEYQLVTKTKEEFEKMKCNKKIEITDVTEQNDMKVKGYQMTFYDFPFQVIDNDVFFNVAKSKRSLHAVLASNATKALELYSETLDSSPQVVYLDMNKTYKGGKVRSVASVNKIFMTVKKVYARKYLLQFFFFYICLLKPYLLHIFYSWPKSFFVGKFRTVSRNILNFILVFT